ncbi:glycosyltransferase family 57 protein [Piedraia hortae CBS 480.64]|uniref:Alpha-1,3-glucosyltransferase n=1 Tax=Piedraia hortae CBS 480.64 TaxID=1314780 RepID=A0A6A7BVB7_9PEZI|nr:glycosyltransferase family 57 protein [Piedraia hortae CBS 480.64]
MAQKSPKKKKKDEFLLQNLLSPYKPPSKSNTAPLLVCLTALLFRWATALWPYSGMAKPPLYGDFEAQRHWMEITSHLPMSHWYFYDLEWWGLDYPPLTAYHSWLLGRLGSLIDSSWFALYVSRGVEDYGLKVFMRASVAASEILVYAPAVVMCVRRLGKDPWSANLALTAILMQPALILIDHGHFQYNSVMLGFAAATIAALLTNDTFWACLFFVAALGFKQMALFYAPAIAAFLAGTCFVPRCRPATLCGIALVTLLLFGVLFAPLLLGTAYDVRRNALPTSVALDSQLWHDPYLAVVKQAIHRIFPFARGLFEDKVANIWCFVHSSGLFKLSKYDTALLSRAALGLTLVFITPPCLLLFLHPQKKALLPALAASSWGFFLCSYQVHEKNVLLPLLPMTLLLASEGGLTPSIRAWVGYANILGCWTMFPLVARDGLRVPYFVLTLLWAYLIGLPTVYKSNQLNTLTKLIHIGSYVAMAAWHIIESTIPPPEKLPDLWVVGNISLGCAAFVLCYLWCLLLAYNSIEVRRVGKKKTQ